ncbi:DUF6444 domain-containing protein [Hoeflea sp.]|uniref:DUF6444 domain-containing protein n=1 Tax=Hoeflea sp. TaxID=1940281 RepID=UPI00199C4782|nr:DUF6444 domain-containing protein [Hoeflea sp.]MBC7284636.1 hypothetical protein [Hoeflea sp.]
MPKPPDMEITRAVLEKAPRETLIQIIELLAARNAQLEERVEELEARINQNSSNSNKPPSSDPPYRKQKKQHKKKHKTLSPNANPAKVIGSSSWSPRR